jgi:hemoglobin-like flavoprotein
MTLETHDRVQESWAQATAAGTAALAEAFYEHLLERDPQLGRLFRGAEMREQGRVLTRSLSTLLHAAGYAWSRPADDAPPSAIDAWQVPHLAVVGHALFDTLAQALGDRFTPAVREGWADLFAAHAAEIRRAALRDAGTSRVVPLRRRRLVEIGS